VRILAIADEVSPFIYSENFPHNLPPFDLVLSAGDMPGYVRDNTREHTRLPGGCLNAHAGVLEIGGVLIAGFEGSARYRPGPHQYSEWQMHLLTRRLTPRLLLNQRRYGRAVDVLLTHAPPKGPHEGADFPHRGVGAFNRFVDLWRPKLHVHGHVHLNGANAPREYLTESGTRVINAFGFTLIDL
jgi:uncharacterized protein